MKTQTAPKRSRPKRKTFVIGKKLGLKAALYQPAKDLRKTTVAVKARNIVALEALAPVVKAAPARRTRTANVKVQEFAAAPRVLDLAPAIETMAVRELASRLPVGVDFLPND